MVLEESCELSAGGVTMAVFVSSMSIFLFWITFYGLPRIAPGILFGGLSLAALAAWKSSSSSANGFLVARFDLVRLMASDVGAGTPSFF